MSTTKKEKEIEERSLTGDSDKDSRGSSSNGDPPRLEAPQGATGQNPKSPETSETPASREGHSLSGTENPGNLEVLTEKVGTLGLQGQKKNISWAAKKRTRRARMAASPRFKAARKRHIRGPVFPSLKVKFARSRGLAHLGLALKRLYSPNRVLVNARDPRAVHQKVGRRSDPRDWVSLVMPELLKDACGWPSSVMATQNSRSPMRILSASNVLLEGLWMGSLKSGSPPSSSIHVGLREQ